MNSTSIENYDDVWDLCKFIIDIMQNIKKIILFCLNSQNIV